MYKNYVFDVYGTLIDIYTNEYDNGVWTKLAEALDFYDVRYTPEELQETYFACCDLQMRAGEDLFKHPEIDVVEVFRQIFNNKGKKANKTLATHMAQVFRAFSTKYIRLYDGVIELLQNLKRAKKKLYILSNAQKCFTLPELNKLGIRRYFNGIMYSSECKCMKPDTAFFNALINKYKLDRRETVFIGNDAATDIAGANASHLDSLYIQSNLSSPANNDVPAKFRIMNGDVNEIGRILLK